MHVQGTFSFLNLVLQKNKIRIRGRIITLGNANHLNVSSCFHQVGLLVSHLDKASSLNASSCFHQVGLLLSAAYVATSILISAEILPQPDGRTW